ncbi:TPA: hypothetical protein N2O60_004404 [Klebsiella pneumoniae]|nr:hypothetical protein [Klebsiella pneumoniae]
MRADIMHGQHIKYCSYTTDLCIRLNNPDLSEAEGKRRLSTVWQILIFLRG